MTAPFDAVELAGIARAMTEAGATPSGSLRADLISGGRSNLTVRLSDDVRSWVLRTPPRHGRTPSAHDVVREFRVTSALAGTSVPVAVPVAVSEDESLIGGPFAIWEHVAGVTVQRREELDGLPASTIGGIADALVDALAALHAQDHSAIGLERFGRPDAYVERQLRRWSGQWELVSPGAPDLDRLALEVVDRLSAQVPGQRSAAVVHGDFRIDNALLALDGPTPRVLAIVDWELSTIGDPVADVAMMCAYRHPAFDGVLGFGTAWTSDLLPGPEGLASRYEAAGGAELHDWDYYLAFAYYRIAVISAGIDFRWRSEGSPEGGNATAGAAVRPFLEAAAGVLSIGEGQDAP
ncbi:phosphotransferase family protein [Nocardioides daeguensis]|uniref:Phosphotransferase family protein n=1 Tax=Nocardioides daeguensis TaxID=908359 RepID=A0ABP6V3M3_9ACTN|nr:phosphotransferase family protein [Nocardioides daeguensis]MBV6726492.1 phosphotransferase family protein [Nocardioides daeguensis]MCR1772335.1 phosphotransferase family protein [Nocardioides daeguensis]